MATSWDPKVPNNAGKATEVSRVTEWRKVCQRCMTDGAHCYVWANRLRHACRRCTAMGIDCYSFTPVPETMGQEHNRYSYPIDSLASIGFGRPVPFPRCSHCHNEDRNCDRQRPCDSCLAASDACDDFRTGRNLINGRLGGETWSSGPGPLYYLALGYGSQGVHVPKDGGQLEHWVGPNVPAYAYPCEVGDDGALVKPKVSLSLLTQRGRDKVKPQGQPPHQILHKPTSVNHNLSPEHHNALPSMWTTEHIQNVIRGAWEPGTPCVPPNKNWYFYEASENTKHQHLQAIGEIDPTTGEHSIAQRAPAVQETRRPPGSLRRHVLDKQTIAGRHAPQGQYHQDTQAASRSLGEYENSYGNVFESGDLLGPNPSLEIDPSNEQPHTGQTSNHLSNQEDAQNSNQQGNQRGNQPGSEQEDLEMVRIYANLKQLAEWEPDGVSGNDQPLADEEPSLQQ
ncbi:hypothetical protein N3K66_000507 [Trichothecium roseum]|uniref:Uncharacterized protein n=1 Tax=Trichothecium roseum TaxID=47278 RepID=A0ACC0VDZ3_9HYPO|nr:hypothetical protein N3K66_000507 [Trichothecium roseum]